MKSMRMFFSENLSFLVVNFSIYLSGNVFVMDLSLRWVYMFGEMFSDVAAHLLWPYTVDSRYFDFAYLE